MELAGETGAIVDAHGTTATNRVAAIFAKRQRTVLFPFQAGEGIQNSTFGTDVEVIGFDAGFGIGSGLAKNAKFDVHDRGTRDSREGGQLGGQAPKFPGVGIARTLITDINHGH